MKKLGIYTFCCLSTIAIARQIVIACADGGYEESGIFAPEVIGTSEQEYFRNLYSNIKTGSYTTAIIFTDQNVSEWKDFLGKHAKSDEIKSFMYEYSIEEIEDLLFSLRGKVKLSESLHNLIFDGYVLTKKQTTRDKLMTTNLIHFVDADKALAFLYYVVYAKRCEIVNKKLNYWGDEPQPKVPIEKIEELIAKGLKDVKGNAYNFIKERYYMQLTRLHYAIKDEQKSTTTGLDAYTFFNENKEFMKDNGAMYFRALGYAAGALQTKNLPLSNALFAKIYDAYPKMKEVAQVSYKPFENDETLNTSLAQIKDTNQKCALLQLQGMHLDDFKALKQIYALKPSSPYLNLLLVRCVNIQEEDLDFYLNNSNQLYFTDKNTTGKEYRNYSPIETKEIYNFIKKVADANNTDNPTAWNLAAGYLAALLKEGQLANKYFELAEQNQRNTTLVKEQIRLLRMVNRLESVNKLNDSLKEKLIPDIDWLLKTQKFAQDLRVHDGQSYLKKKLAKLNKLEGDTLLAICTEPFLIEGFYENHTQIDQLIALIDKPNKTNWEKSITSVYPYTLADLNYMKGILYAYQDKRAEAITYLEKGTPIRLQADPFTARIIDCHDCDFKATKLTITSYNFYKQLDDYIGQAESGINAAENYFKAGNAYYNMSYYGNARAFYEVNFITNASNFYAYIENAPSSFSHFVYDNKLALSYYEKTALASNNEEFKVKCYWMAAKCEQNNWYNLSPTNKPGQMPMGTYYAQMKKQSARTKYYKEIIKECGFFRDYTKSK